MLLVVWFRGAHIFVRRVYARLYVYAWRRGACLAVLSFLLSIIAVSSRARPEYA